MSIDLLWVIVLECLGWAELVEFAFAVYQAGRISVTVLPSRAIQSTVAMPSMLQQINIFALTCLPSIRIRTRRLFCVLAPSDIAL